MFAIVELMGHRQRAGQISDATIGGATMLRIEHPSAEGLPGEPLTEYYAPSAIVSIRPCSEEMACAAAQTLLEVRPMVPSESRRLAYTPAEAANALRVCRQTIYNLAAQGELRFVKIGRATRIPASDVERLAGGGLRTEYDDGAGV